MPSRLHSPCHLATGDMSVDIPAAGEAGRELTPATEFLTDTTSAKKISLRYLHFSEPCIFWLRSVGQFF